MTNNKTQRLTTTGILIALGTILSFIKVYDLPYGGSITLFSMVPVMLAGFMYGPKWGLLAGAVYGSLQGVFGATMSAAFAGQKLWGVILIALLDYLVAFSIIGLAGIFRKKDGRHAATAFALGALVTSLLRLAAHFASGVILFGGWAEWYFSQEGFYSFGSKILERYSGLALSAVYSLIYNASYMIPETALSVLAALALMNVKPIRNIAVSKTNIL